MSNREGGREISWIRSDAPARARMCGRGERWRRGRRGRNGSVGERGSNRVRQKRSRGRGRRRGSTGRKIIGEITERGGVIPRANESWDGWSRKRRMKRRVKDIVGGRNRRKWGSWW